jgi:amidase
MQRRSFLVAGAAVGLSGGCVASAPSAPVATTTPPAPRTPPTPAPHADVEEASIAELSARMTRGELTSRELVTRYLERIEALDRSGPTLRSILETNPDALAIATRLDAERRAKGPRGPLHGIPVLLKDNIDTGDRMQTTAGSLALAGAPAPGDAHLVARLREAGAVVLGKTNLSEWANIRDGHSTSGWSARGGLTRNPYALDRNTSGSSSGSAAAVAASLAAVAVGTETNGSIMSPSQMQGLVGVKPTVGLVSRTGIVPISHTQDTAGPMARTVTDAAILLGAMAGADPRDPATAAAARAVTDYARALDRGSLRAARLGVLRFPWVGPTVKPAFEAALDALKGLGATLVDVEPKKSFNVKEPELDLLLFELKADLPAYLATRGQPELRTLADIVRFNERHAAEELHLFGQDLFEKALAKGDLGSAGYALAKDACRRASRDEGIDAILAADAHAALDAVVAPTGGPAWLTDPVNGDSFTGAGYGLAAVAGYPSVTVPCGATHGLPLGLCFMGAPWSEPRLLAMAYAYEQATRHRARPTFAPSAVL